MQHRAHPIVYTRCTNTVTPLLPPSGVWLVAKDGSKYRCGGYEGFGRVMALYVCVQIFLKEKKSTVYSGASLEINDFIFMRHSHLTYTNRLCRHCVCGQMVKVYGHRKCICKIHGPSILSTVHHTRHTKVSIIYIKSD